MGSEEQTPGTPDKKMETLKIAFVGAKGIPSTYGGVEKHVEELSTRLAARGHRVFVYCRPRYVNGNSDYMDVERVIRPTIMQKHSEMIVHTGLSLLDAMSRNLDIVHFQSVDPAILSIFAKRRARVVVTSHGKAYRVEKWGRVARSLSVIAERFYARIPQSRIAVSRTLTEYYRRTYGCDVSYIPNGVRLHTGVGSSALSRFSLEPRQYILFVGRLVKSKGCHLLLDAYESLETDKQLVIVGDVGYRSTYDERLRSRESEKVKFLGFRFGQDLIELMCNCFMFVQPSESEGLSMSLLEALSSARPVIYSDIPENREVAEGCGLPFNPGDSKDLMAKMALMLSDSAMGENLGIAGREKARSEYDWDKIVDATEEMYAGLL
jgi:glycosyltransferase involved in cell wall biosynthesis